MKILILTFITLLSTTTWATQQFQFKPQAGKVVFKTKGWPNLVTIKGEGTGVSGVLMEEMGKVSGELNFDLTTLKTGIELRDSHMKDNYLDVKQFPTAKLKLTSVEVPNDLDGSIEFKGIMNLHGVQKEISGKADLERDGKTLSMKAEIPLKLSDFKIAIPSYQGITVAEKVKINFETQVMTQ
jgi:polyisoprenoid-binding protein YceI